MSCGNYNNLLVKMSSKSYYTLKTGYYMYSFFPQINCGVEPLSKGVLGGYMYMYMYM